jgi:hypothetical protein
MNKIIIVAFALLLSFSLTMAEELTLKETGIEKIKKGDSKEWTSCEICHFEVNVYQENITLTIADHSKTITNSIKLFLKKEKKVSKLDPLTKGSLKLKPYLGEKDKKFEYNYTMKDKFVQSFNQEFWEGCEYIKDSVICPFANGLVIVNYTSTKKQGIDLKYNKSTKKIKAKGNLSLFDPVIGYDYNELAQDGYIAKALSGGDRYIFIQWNISSIYDIITPTDQITNATLDLYRSAGNNGVETYIYLIDNQSVRLDVDSTNTLYTMNKINQTRQAITDGFGHRILNATKQLIQNINNTENSLFTLRIEVIGENSITPDYNQMGDNNFMAGDLLGLYTTFISKEYASPSLRPTLNISYESLTPPTSSDTCSYSGSGNWIINSSCNVTYSNMTVYGETHILNDGDTLTGSLLLNNSNFSTSAFILNVSAINTPILIEACIGTGCFTNETGA